MRQEADFPQSIHLDTVAAETCWPQTERLD